MYKDVSINKLQIDNQEIHISWTDGHDSKYNAKYLRINCGCAQCVEEWSNRKLLDPATVAADIRAEDYLSVGRYAIQFLWSDEHFTGIYPYKMLRDLCQCIDCNNKNIKLDET